MRWLPALLCGAGGLGIFAVFLGFLFGGVFYEDTYWPTAGNPFQLLFWLLIPLGLLTLAGWAAGVFQWLRSRNKDDAVPLLTVFVTAVLGPVQLLSIPGVVVFGSVMMGWMTRYPMVIEGRLPRNTRAPRHDGTDTWSDMASFELGSIGAFSILAIQLQEAGAPVELVERCRQAAREEARHAVGALERSNATSFEPWPVTVPRQSWWRLAWESLVDGWLNELLAAEKIETLALEEPAHADFCRQVVTEERTHAVLSRDIALWALLGRRFETSQPVWAYAALDQLGADPDPDLLVSLLAS